MSSPLPARFPASELVQASPMPPEDTSTCPENRAARLAGLHTASAPGTTADSARPFFTTIATVGGRCHEAPNTPTVSCRAGRIYGCHIYSMPSSFRGCPVKPQAVAAGFRDDRMHHHFAQEQQDAHESHEMQRSMVGEGNSRNAAAMAQRAGLISLTSEELQQHPRHRHESPAKSAAHALEASALKASPAKRNGRPRLCHEGRLPLQSRLAVAPLRSDSHVRARHGAVSAVRRLPGHGGR